jgi:serine/threonine-protein kinase
MTPERYQQVNRLLDEVFELNPEERSAHLSATCNGDEELRREVESLLQAHHQAHSFIKTLVAAEAKGLLGEQRDGEMIGRTLGHYQLRSLLGAGGMGEVYRAADTRLDREVAVKILPAHLARDVEALHRFEREAKAVAALSHPNVCPIYDFGIEQGVTYAVMELLEGETLRAHLACSALPWREAAQIGVGVADGLVAAHAKGIIHRDLKPENIFLTSGGQVKVLDFGIARVKRVVSAETKTNESAVSANTKPGTVLGTIGYMSPEQVRGEGAEATSDIFSLGCVLYEMVVGERPFARRTQAETIAAILKEEPPTLADTGKGIPRQVERVIRHCLEKQPGARYQSAQELAVDLSSLLAPSKTPLLAPALAQSRLRPAMGGAAAMVVVLLGVLVWWYLASGRGPMVDSLAILPLVNASGNVEMEYLSDGLSESLINSLSQLPQLKRIIARSTMASYKGKEIDPRRVGQELHVQAVLTGRMTQRGDQLIIEAELVNVVDGARLWGGIYDRKLAETLTLQNEMAREISAKMRLALTGEQQQRLAKRHTENPQAHELYLKGLQYNNPYTVDGFKLAIDHMQRAIDLDPGYALAWAGLALSYFNASNLYLAPSVAMPKAKFAAERALELDDTLAEAHTILGVYQGQYEWKWTEAEKAFQRALELSPGYAFAHQCYAWQLTQQGRLEDAIVMQARARELDPLTPFTSTSLAYMYYLADRNDEALAQLQSILQTNPNFVIAHVTLGLVYHQQGKFEQAISEFDQSRARDPGQPAFLSLSAYTYAVWGKRNEALRLLAELQEKARKTHIDPFHTGIIYVGLGEKDQAFVWFEKALEERSEELLGAKVNPRLDSIRDDPRFTALLQAMNPAR